MSKINCWQFCKCGREPGGAKVNLLGVCPVPLARNLNGVNGGINGGRICWSIAGTFSPYRRAQLDCLKAKEIKSCFECDFHQLVLKEEGLTVDPPQIKPEVLELEI